MIGGRFLDGLAPNDRDALDKSLTLRYFDKDQTVLLKDDKSSDIYFVIEGRARATIFSEDGKVVAYRDILAGDVFGELSAVDRLPRSANIFAITDLQVGLMSRQRFLRLLSENSNVALTLIEYFTLQMRWMTERIFEFSTMLVRERLVRELLRLAKSGRAADGEIILQPSPTHFELAARISSHREAVSREMSELAKANLISKKSGGLTFHNLSGLRSLLDDENDL